MNWSNWFGSLVCAVIIGVLYHFHPSYAMGLFVLFTLNMGDRILARLK